MFLRYEVNLVCIVVLIVNVSKYTAAMRVYQARSKKGY